MKLDFYFFLKPLGTSQAHLSVFFSSVFILLFPESDPASLFCEYQLFLLIIISVGLLQYGRQELGLTSLYWLSLSLKSVTYSIYALLSD